MTPPVSFEAGRVTTLRVAPRRERRREHGGPPRVPPEDSDGGGADGSGRGPAPAGGADEVGPFALALAMAGITTLFAVLIAVWLFLRRPAPDWRVADAGVLDALVLGTACLVASSAAVELAARRARGGAAEQRATLRWLGASLVLGAAFLAAQVYLWIGLWRAGLVPSASGYAAVLFALTGLHALHALGGLGFLGALALWLRQRAEHVPSVRLGAVYWHFMGALWLVLFTLLYFVR